MPTAPRKRINPLIVGAAAGFAFSLGLLPIVLLIAFMIGFMIEGHPDQAAVLLSWYAKAAVFPPLIGFCIGLVIRLFRRSPEA